MSNSKLIMLSFALAAAVFALPLLISKNSHPDSTLDEVSTIEQMVAAAYAGSRFDEIDIEIKSCTLSIVRRDNHICSEPDRKSGLFEFRDFIDLSKLDEDSVALGSSRDVGGHSVTLLRIKYDQVFVEAVEAVRGEYSEFLSTLTESQWTDPDFSRISPFFEDHGVSNLPAHGISKSCHSGASLNLNGRSHPIFLSGPNVTSAPRVFASAIRSCRRN